MSFDFSAWARQPSTLTGIGSLLGLAAGAAAYATTRDPLAAAGAATAAFAAVNMGVDDATANQPPVEKLVSDGIQAAVSGHLAQMAPMLVTETSSVLGSLFAPKTATVQTVRTEPVMVAGAPLRTPVPTIPVVPPVAAS